ncbi:MAG TPA: hypothetical protein VGX50_10335 [Longimicrobium sp.]|nr:hypothetical protein [Longimicrobium sp.]
MMNATRVLLAFAGAAVVAAVSYGLSLIQFADEYIVEGYTVWDVVGRDVVIVSAAAGLALLTPGRRGLRVLWALVGAYWIWLLAIPPFDTADGGPPGVPLLSRFPYWSGIALPLLVVTLAHWRAAYRSVRDLWTPGAVLAVWIALFWICERYGWINSDVIWGGVEYGRVALLCWIFLAAPPLLIVRWILRTDRAVHPSTTPMESWLRGRLAPRLRNRWSAAAVGVGAAAAGFILIALVYMDVRTIAVRTVVICSLLAGPGFGLALRRRMAAVEAVADSAQR